MPPDFYGEESEANPASPQPEPDKDESMEHDGDSGETTLIPKSLLAGKEFKPGEEVVLKIVHIYEDEVEVSYSTGKDEEKPEKPKSQMQEAEGALEKMGKPAMGGY